MLKKIVLASLVGVTLSACGSVGDAIRDAQDAQNERYTQAQLNNYYNTPISYTIDGDTLNFGNYSAHKEGVTSQYKTHGHFDGVRKSYSVYGIYTPNNTNRLPLQIVSGVNTVVSDIPNGEATYTGSAMQGYDNNFYFQANVSFDSHSVDGYIKSTTNKQYYIHLVPSINGVGKGTNRFSGRAETSTGDTGKYNAGLFGPRGAEIGGQVLFDNKPQNNTVFAGSKE